MDVEVAYRPYARTRLWLLNDGFTAAHEIIVYGCKKIYPLSCRLAISDEANIRYYDINNPSTFFDLYETDTYPPDGYKSMYFYPHDFIPGPFGNIGDPGTNSEFERLFSVHWGVIAPNPNHGRHNVSQLSPARLRKSQFIEHFGFEADHVFRNGEPTASFLYSLDASDLTSDRGPNVRGLLRHFDLKPVTDAELQALPGFAHTTRQLGTVEFQHNSFYEQEWDPRSARWRGFAMFKVKTGWLSWEWQKIFLE